MKRSCRQFQGRFHFGDAVEAVDQAVLGRSDFRIGEDLGINDQVGALGGLLHNERRGPPVIAVFRDEALAEPIDDDALYELSGRVD